MRTASRSKFLNEKGSPVAGALMIISTVDGGILRALGYTGARVVVMVERRRAAGSCEALDLASLHTLGPFRR